MFIQGGGIMICSFYLFEIGQMLTLWLERAHFGSRQFSTVYLYNLYRNCCVMIPYLFPDVIRHQKEFGMMKVETHFMDKRAQDLLQHVILSFLGQAT